MMTDPPKNEELKLWEQNFKRWLLYKKAYYEKIVFNRYRRDLLKEKKKGREKTALRVGMWKYKSLKNELMI